MRLATLFGKVARLPDLLWTPLIVAILMLTAGSLGLLLHQPWLFASLGPTAYLYGHTPNQASARFYNTVIGHTAAILAAFIAVVLVHAETTPSVFTTHELTWPRVAAAVLALTVAVPAELLLGASHPPAAATALLIALGGFNVSMQSAASIVIGVLMVGSMGEVFRRIRIQGQHKSHADLAPPSL